MRYTAQFCNLKVRKWNQLIDDCITDIGNNLKDMDFENAKQRDTLEKNIEDMKKKLRTTKNKINDYTFK